MKLKTFLNESHIQYLDAKIKDLPVNQSKQSNEKNELEYISIRIFLH